MISVSAVDLNSRKAPYSNFGPKVDVAAPGGADTIVAGTDRDDDGFICDLEEACGSFRDPVTITPGEDRPGIEILMGELASPQSARFAAKGVQGKKASIPEIRSGA